LTLVRAPVIETTVMKQGIYHVTFHSSSNQVGEGLAVFKDGTVNGGDPGYLYLGEYKVLGDQVNGSLRVKRWNPGVTSVFGNISEFQLTVAGKVTNSGANFDVQGGTGQQGMNVSIRGRWLSDPA
jgi:hypothetical protein